MNVIPEPLKPEFATGSLELSPSSRIVATAERLAPLGQVLAAELELVTGLALPVSAGRGRAGDVVLALRGRSAGEAYELAVDDRITIRGGSYDAVAAGTVTLLQSLETGRQRRRIRCQSVEDQPAFGFRGLMVDLARQWHSIETIKRLVVLCRWYKVNVLHLHLTDDQSFTFPSVRLPSLPTPDRHYSLADLRELEAFAAQRGVTLLPELDVPGHSAAMLAALPKRVGCDPIGKVDLCPGRSGTYRVLDALIGEMCSVFTRSPWFHIGADESQRTSWTACRHCRAMMRRHGLADTEELYRYFLIEVDRIVRSHGRKTIVWEGFSPGGRLRLPNDVAVMVFESDYHTSPQLVEAGYPVINTSWRPLYVCERQWPTAAIHRWNPWRWESPWPRSKAFGAGIDISPTPLLMGAEVCSWGQADAAEMPSLRERLAAMSDRTWNPATRAGEAGFFRRLEHTDGLLNKMLFTTRPRAAWPWFALEPD